MSRGDGGHRTGLARMRAAGFFPLALVALALVALAVLPVAQVRRIALMEEEIEQVLEPARATGQDLTVLQARQMAQFQSYLLSGDARFAEAYRGLLVEESAAFEELQALVERADLGVRAEMAALHAASQAWQVPHEGEEGPLASQEGRIAYLDRLAGERERYARVLGAADALERSIRTQVREARARMDEARRTQMRLSIALAVLALGATVAVGVVGRRLGEAVREAEERRVDALRARREMQAILEASADGVVGMDLEGRCTSLNRTGSELLAITEHGARGRSVHDLVHGRAPPEEAHDAEACPLLQALGSGRERQESEDVIWRRDGTSFPARWHLRPLVDGREVRGGVLTLSDMTDVREAEAALKRAVRARDEMMAVVSHDLRNPLGTVAAAADLLVDLPLSPEKRTEQVQIIRRAAGRMSRLIEDLLDVARIEARALLVAPAPVPVRALVEETVALFRTQAEGKGLTLTSSIEDGLPPMLADRSRMEQVLSNLLANAVKFTDEGGRVTVVGRSAGDRVRISVADTGQGIDSESLKHLFDRFWQVDSGRQDGAGLGLTIVEGIVRAHGGCIEVESEPGEGSLFHVEIPVAEAPTDEGGAG